MLATQSTNASDNEPAANVSTVARRHRVQSWRQFALPLSLAGLCLWVGIAFAGFVREVNSLKAPTPVAADGIVVVTGGSARIEVALELLADGAAERLLISGVHDRTDAATLVARTHADAALFDCCVDLDHAALDTAGNAREASSWAREHQFRSLLVVTSSYHIARTTQELAHHLPGVELVAFPIDPASDTQRATGRQEGSWPTSLLVREFVKLQVARLRHLVERA
jgi:uncharacterized SAM-binding protein YcdF (DUF218 family)